MDITYCNLTSFYIYIYRRNKENIFHHGDFINAAIRECYIRIGRQKLEENLRRKALSEFVTLPCLAFQKHE